ncbi:MAG: multi-sensor signal transduction histidine kinase [Pedosphaera sp.]|nr:multi-sensor signal transduction histidine kinase [Pedosphaera sp.]
MGITHKHSRKQLRPRSAPSRPDSYSDRERLISELELQVTQFRMQEQELLRTQEQVEHVSQYYSGLFNTAPVGYVVLNAFGNILEINDAGASLLRWKRPHLINEPFARFVVRDMLPEFLKHLRACKSATKPVSIELTLQDHEGGLTPVELVSTPFAGADHAIHFRTAIIDITERRRTEQALRQSQHNYHNLIDSIQGIVWEGVAGEDCRFTFVSQQAERLLGYPVARWLREPDFWLSRIHQDDRERVLKLHKQAVDETKSFVVEFRMLTSERHVLWLRNSVNVTRDPQGVIKLQGVMINITELKEAGEALQEEKRTLETLHQVGTALVGELDLDRVVQVVTEAGMQIAGALFGAFSYKRLNGHGEQFALYTTPGAPRDIFERLPLPQHHPATSPAETERETIRIDDVLHDSRAPHPHSRRRAPSLGPPVRSYLAVPVVSRSGEVLGGLLLGHPAPGVFTERSQHLVAGLAAEAGIALDNARLYHAVTKSESHFRQLADAMPQIVWTALPNGRVDYFNRRWYEFTGLPNGSLDDQGWMPFVLEEDCRRCHESWRTAVAAGQIFQVECRLKEQKTGAPRWHLIRALPIRDEKDRIVSWFGTCTDIDDQKNAERQVRELNTALERRVLERTAQLQASNKELEAFSYSVSHDLRAPLRSIDAFSQLVREDYNDKLDDQGRQYLGIVGEASRQMSRLIDDLLHLSRVTRTEMRRQPVDLAAIARSIIASLRQLEPERQVDIVIAPDLRANGDERLLRIAFENLLNNAWKFTAKQPAPKIEVGSEIKDGQTVFFVRDNGAGFDMAFADKLFGAFQRLHSTVEFPGHGIGLATVQRIINRHGGRIWAVAAPDQGATFYFTLPNQA